MYAIRSYYANEWIKVLDDPLRSADAVEEVLRYWAPSQYQGRFSHRDSQFHGVTIPAGEPVLLLTGAANRDEREYEDPDRFDIDRPQGLRVGLGHGIHSCLGAALARSESRIRITSYNVCYTKLLRSRNSSKAIRLSLRANAAPKHEFV